MMPERDATAEHLDGERRGHRADTLKFSDPDSIARGFIEVMAADGVAIDPTPRLLGYARVLRKMLEARS